MRVLNKYLTLVIGIGIFISGSLVLLAQRGAEPAQQAPEQPAEQAPQQPAQQAPQEPAQQAPQQPAQQAGGRGQRGPQEGGPLPAGLNVAGEVQNYVPVTDAMLRKPDPGDWLMIRRDYYASDYSPLTQITPQNVKDLQLVFMSPMNEGGTNQPAPIVHSGVSYLANTGGVMQAIDGATGKIIWENRLGSNIAMRGITIYQDKLYLASGNRVIALDARKGNIVWSTEIGQG